MALIRLVLGLHEQYENLLGQGLDFGIVICKNYRDAGRHQKNHNLDVP